jgi:xanthine/uracil permease
MNLLTEAIITGFIVLLIGTLIVAIMKHFGNLQFDKNNEEWNKNHVMELSLFLTGVFTHLLCEITGVNKMYIDSHCNKQTN